MVGVVESEKVVVKSRWDDVVAVVYVQKSSFDRGEPVGEVFECTACRVTSA